MVSPLLRQGLQLYDVKVPLVTGAQELPDLVGRLLQVGVVHQGAPGLLSRRSPLSQSSASLAPALAQEGN